MESTVLTTTCETPRLLDTEPLVVPTRQAAHHHFDVSPQSCESECGPVRTIAVWPCAIDNKLRVSRPSTDDAFHNLAVRKAYSAWNVRLFEELTASNVEQHKVLIALLHGLMNVPAVGFELELSAEVLQSPRGWGKGVKRNGARHESDFA